MDKGKYNTYHKRFKTVLERFEERFVKKSSFDCWIWQGSIRNKYGQFYFQKTMKASRVSWIIYRGDIPEGKYICHHCDNTLCVNPDHLYVGDAKTNMKDKINRQRGNVPYGSRHPNSKLNEEKVKDILTSHLKGKDLAKKYNIGEMEISRIKRGLRWRKLYESHTS